MLNGGVLNRWYIFKSWRVELAVGPWSVTACGQEAQVFAAEDVIDTASAVGPTVWLVSACALRASGRRKTGKRCVGAIGESAQSPC